MTETMVFPALLKYWRGVRGMSQLDLSLAADVSARHLSFLETGRSKPSEDMVLRLCATLGIPLREQSALLIAAGFQGSFESEDSTEVFHPRLQSAVSRMMEQQEPYPLIVMDRHYNVVAANDATGRLLSAVLGDRASQLVQPDRPINLLRLTFDPDALRAHILEWESLARTVLLRVQREALQNPADHGLADLLDELLRSPDVPADWRMPDFSRSSEAVIPIRFAHGDEELGFLTTLTVFNAPLNAELEELHIESYFPLDATTEKVCAALAT